MGRQTDSAGMSQNNHYREISSPENIYQACSFALFLIGIRRRRRPRPVQFVLFRILHVLASLALLGGGLAACGSDNAPLPPGTILTAITVDPSNLSVALGTTVQLHATGVFSNGTTEDLTQSVTWSSSDATIAVVGNAAGSQGLVAGEGLGVTTITATNGRVQGSSTLTVTPATLTSITIDPALPSIAKGTTIQLAAIGNFSDGTTQDLTESVTWASLDATIAQVSDSSGSKGLASGAAIGSATISAAESGITGSAKIAVTAATLTSITIDPALPSIAKGTKIQLAAIGNFSDGTTQDLTESVTWVSLDATIAQVSDSIGSKGLAAGVAIGGTTITASESGITGSTKIGVTAATLTSITIDPALPSIAKGTTIQLAAIGSFSDGTTQDLTSFVTWTSSDEAIAHVGNAVGNQGLVTGLAVGSAVVTAIDGAVQGSTTVSVTVARLTAITVDPAASSIAKGTTVQLTATGDFTDGTTEDLTTQVSWTSSDDTIAEVSDILATKGLVTGIALGSALITAALDGVQGSATVVVTQATLTSITVTPANPSISKGTTVQLAATAHFSDSTTEDLTSEVSWISADDTIAEVSNMLLTKGLVTGIAVGSALITATLDGVQGSTTVIVTPATLTSITVTPPNPSIVKHTTVQESATAHFSDSTTQDVTHQVSWTSADNTIANVSNRLRTKGLVTGLHVGAALIIATLDGVQGSTTVTVTRATLTAITVQPANPTIGVFHVLQLTANGHFSDGTIRNLTQLVDWMSSNPKVAHVISSSWHFNGLVFAWRLGKTTIAAKFGDVEGSTVVKVVP